MLENVEESSAITIRIPFTDGIVLTAEEQSDLAFTVEMKVRRLLEARES